MKKICYVTTISLTLKSFIVSSAEYLKENTDWQITMVCDDDDDFAKNIPDGIRYVPISMKRGISLSGIFSVIKLVKFFKKEKFDLVQFSTPNASMYVSIAAKIAKVPVRLYCQWGIVYVGFSGIKRKIFKTIEKFVCSNATQIEPDSFGNLKFSQSERLYKASKGRVIWNGSASGVNLDKFDFSQKEQWRKDIRKKYNLSDNDFVYGFVGRITGDKGINELFESFKQVKNKYPQAHLMLVGNTEKADSVNDELYNWAEKEENVHFCGYSNNVEHYLSAMDVYVLPSYREGFGSSVVEAEAMGVPVIVSDIPGPTDAMLKNQTGLTVPAKDVDSLKTAMEKLLVSKELCEQYGNNAKQFAKERFEQKKLFSYIKEDREKLLGIFS